MRLNQNFYNYLDEFLNFTSLSDSSKKIYFISINRCLEYFDSEDLNFNNLEYSDWQNFIFYLKSVLNLSNISLSKELAALRSFSKFLFQNQLLNQDYSTLLKNPKTKRKLPNTLTHQQIINILSSIDTSNVEGKRNYLVLELLYATGLRLSELVNIKRSDIDFDNQLIKVVGKGNKERICLFYPSISQRIIELFNLTNSEYLFVNKFGNQISQRSIQNILKKIEKESGSFVELHPHLLRHSFASNMLANGADLMTIKEILGHELLSTTEIYLHLSDEHLKKDYQKYHPRAIKK